MAARAACSSSAPTRLTLHAAELLQGRLVKAALHAVLAHHALADGAQRAGRLQLGVQEGDGLQSCRRGRQQGQGQGSTQSQPQERVGGKRGPPDSVGLQRGSAACSIGAQLRRLAATSSSRAPHAPGVLG